MLKERARLFSLLMRLADASVVALAFATAFFTRFVSGVFPTPPGPPPLSDYLLVAPFAVGLALVSFELLGLYRPRRIELGLGETRDVLFASALAVVLLLAAAELQRATSTSRLFVAVYALVLPLGLASERALVRALLRSLRRRGLNTRRALVVGDGAPALAAIERIRANPWTGIHVVGALVPEVPAAGESLGVVPVLGTSGELERAVAERAVDQVFVALPLERATLLRGLRPVLDRLPVDLLIIPDTAGFFPMNPSVTELDGLPVVTVRAGPHEGLNGLLKRSIDVTLASLGLVVLAPILLFIGAAVRLTSRGPALYRQMRVGFGGRPFVIFKFRTMVDGAEAETGPVRTARGDPRRTWLGTFLRRTSLDELPQLLNVLRGDMSLVGPRPERPELMEELGREHPEAFLRLTVKAGMTGLAQVRGLRGDTSLRERLKVDLEYVRRWSVWLDLEIMAMTLVRGFVHENAI